MNEEDHFGLWTTRTGVRLDLAPDGRFGKQMADGRSASGAYWKEGPRIRFQSDEGKSATGRLMNGVLTAGPHLYLREWPAEAPAPPRETALLGFARSAARWAFGGGGRHWRTIE